MKEPPAVHAGESAVSLERSDRRADGGALRCHECGEDGLGEFHGQADPVRADGAPAVGEMPQQHVQPRLDLRLLHDRHIDGEVAGSADRAGNQLRGDLRERLYSLRELEVEHREPARFEHLPAELTRDGRDGVLALPRSQQITACEQFDAEAITQAHAPKEEAVKDEQPEAVSQRWRPSVVLPLPARYVHHGGASDLDCSSELGRSEALGKPRVFLENAGEPNTCGRPVYRAAGVRGRSSRGERLRHGPRMVRVRAASER